MKKKLLVTYTVTYQTEIEVDAIDDDDDLAESYSDDICDINIPEDETSVYQKDSFEVDSVESV